MLRKVLLASVAGLVLVAGAAPVMAQAAGSRPAATAAFQEGLFGVRLDREKGKVLVRLPAPGEEPFSAQLTLLAALDA